MTFLEKVDFMMERYNLNKSSLSQKTGIPYTTIVNWYKRGCEGVNMDTLRKLSNYFNTFVDFWVLEKVTDPNHGKENSFSMKLEETQHIIKYRSLDPFGKKAVESILDVEYQRCKAQTDEEPGSDNVKVIQLRCSTQSASAGTGCYLGPEEWDTISVLENDITRQASFCVPVSGDSMEPKYHDGDILMINNKAEVELGQVGLYTLDGEGYVKVYGGDRLISLNPDYPEILLHGDTRCNGKVIGILNSEWIVED